jgi:hypothetical protein
MFARLRAFLNRHPLVRDALLWAVPAILFGAVLRGLLLHYLPYAYWGSDSRSYYGFTEQFLDTGKISLYDKRRYLYLIGLLPVTLLPGAPLKWLAWLQHGMGLATLVPLAYCVRKAFVGWKVWIIPVTVLYAGLPILLWYEHELLAECVFFHGVVWMIAGWMAFAPARGAAVPRNFWWFFAGVAVVLLTKPSGRFFLPAIVLGLLALQAWRVLRVKQWVALGAVVALTFTIGQDSQAAWMLYASAFPLTRLDTPLHAEYKAELADLVPKAREVRSVERNEGEALIKYSDRQDKHPLWKALAKDEKKKEKVCHDLAREAILGNPVGFLQLAGGKIIASANPDEFGTDRFLPSYYVEKYASQFEKDSKEKPERIRRLFALRKDVPDYEHFKQWIAPYPDSAAAKWLHDYADRYHAGARMVTGGDENAAVSLTPLAWWILLACVLALVPAFFRPLGIPVLAAVSYLFGTFLVGGNNPRYFGAVWGIVVLAMCVPLDLILRAWWKPTGASAP